MWRVSFLENKSPKTTILISTLESDNAPEYQFEWVRTFISNLSSLSLSLCWITCQKFITMIACLQVQKSVSFLLQFLIFSIFVVLHNFVREGKWGKGVATIHGNIPMCLILFFPFSLSFLIFSLTIAPFFSLTLGLKMSFPREETKMENGTKVRVIKKLTVPMIVQLFKGGKEWIMKSINWENKAVHFIWTEMKSHIQKSAAAESGIIRLDSHQSLGLLLELFHQPGNQPLSILHLSGTFHAGEKLSVWSKWTPFLSEHFRLFNMIKIQHNEGERS